MSLLSRLTTILQGILAVIPTVEIVIEALPRKRKRERITSPSSKTGDARES